MRLGGQYVAKAPPMIHFFGTGPQNRESSDAPRLSPIMNQWSLGTVIWRGKEQSSPGWHGRMKSSLARWPLRTTRPLTIRRRSPGPATTRLMKLTSERVLVGFEQAAPSGWGAPHWLVSAPLGGWKTRTSPT